MLAGLVKSPSRLAPTRNFDGAERRAQTVLAAMADLQFHQPTPPSAWRWRSRRASWRRSATAR